MPRPYHKVLGKSRRAVKGGASVCVNGVVVVGNEEADQGNGNGRKLDLGGAGGDMCGGAARQFRVRGTHVLLRHAENAVPPKAKRTTKNMTLNLLKNSAPATLMRSTQKRPALPMPRTIQAGFAASGKKVVCTAVAKPMV